MQGRKQYQEKLFVTFQMSERVPQENLYRRLKEELDLNFLYQSTSRYYGTEGQASIDPVVFFKLMLVGYLENLGSDRKIISHASLRLDVLYFIGYDLDEELPWHSTLSRTRQLYGEEVFLEMFRRVLKLCISKGMVRGKRQAIDSAFIKANASLDSLIEKLVLSEVETEVIEDAEAYSRELDAELEEKAASAELFQTVTAERKKWVEQHHRWKAEEYKDQPGSVNKTGHTNKIGNKDEHGDIIRPKFLSNHTHYSPTDPDARISVKPGKARQLNYYSQLAVDDAHHVITGAAADFADKRDSQCLANILGQTIENLKEHQISIDQICADTAYSSGESLSYAELQNIDAWIPNFGQYKPVREGFTYNKEQDQYECQRGNRAILPFRKIVTDSKGYDKRVYRSTNAKCKDCPLRSECIGRSDFKKIEESIHKPYYDRMHQKMQTDYARKIMRIRSRTVEPVLGTLLNFMNMKRVNTRGIGQANKHVLLAALSYNLKKYLNFQHKKAPSIAIALTSKMGKALKHIKIMILGFKQAILTHLNFQKNLIEPKTNIA